MAFWRPIARAQARREMSQVFGWIVTSSAVGGRLQLKISDDFKTVGICCLTRRVECGSANTAVDCHAPVV